MVGYALVCRALTIASKTRLRTARTGCGRRVESPAPTLPAPPEVEHEEPPAPQMALPGLVDSILSTISAQYGAPRIEVVLNWTEELKARVPTK